MYPQAVYFPIRTLYLTLKIEQRERYKSGRYLWVGVSIFTAAPGRDHLGTTGLSTLIPNGCP